MNEIWKDIEGFEGYYQVSNLGKVRSLDRTIHCKNGKSYFQKGIVLGDRFDEDGYLHVILYKDGVRKTIKVYRLVAEAFIPNPNNFKMINHKDEVKTNNRVDNLEWCTAKYNANYGTRNERVAEQTRFSVNQYDMNGNFIANYKGLRFASEKTGADISAIAKVCKGKGKSAKGYIWKYA